MTNKSKQRTLNCFVVKDLIFLIIMTEKIYGFSKLHVCVCVSDRILVLFYCSFLTSKFLKRKLYNFKVFNLFCDKSNTFIHKIKRVILIFIIIIIISIWTWCNFDTLTIQIFFSLFVLFMFLKL